MTARLLVVIPAYNEAASIPLVVDELRQFRPRPEVLVVDDASDDDTPAILAHLDVPFLRLPVRLGIGGAVRAGLRYAHLKGFQTVVRMDGDGQHRTVDIDRLLTAMHRVGADVALGSRYLIPSGYSATGARRTGQRLLAQCLTLLTGQPVTDPTSGFWAFGPRAVRFLADHHPSGYPEPELLLLLSRNDMRVVEVPAAMRGRLAGRTSLTVSRSSLALARVMLALLVVPLRPPVSGLPP